jgi:hypothetical protein
MVAPSLVALAEAVVKTARAPRAKKAAIELTDAAAERIKQLLLNRHKVGRRCDPHVVRARSPCPLPPASSPGHAAVGMQPAEGLRAGALAARVPNPRLLRRPRRST